MRTSTSDSTPMALSPHVIDEGRPLHDELVHLYAGQRARVDAWMYNGGTVVSLLASGIGTVVAVSGRHDVLAASLAAVTTFFVAVTRILDFGGRWKWHLQRRARYAALIYRLNAAGLHAEARQRVLIGELYVAMERERHKDGLLPGSGEPDVVPPPEPAARPPHDATAPEPVS